MMMFRLTTQLVFYKKWDHRLMWNVAVIINIVPKSFQQKIHEKMNESRLNHFSALLNDFKGIIQAL